jgi:hypothetical protein
MGLIKTGLKAAVAVKTADVIHERIQARQQAQWVAHGHPGGMPPAGMAPAGMPAPAAPAAAAADTGSTLAQLAQLGELRAAGVLTEAEFEAQKARILSG